MTPINEVMDNAASYHDLPLALWVFAFASSHIGMSAVRTSIISSLGGILSNNPLGINLVGNEGWTLPDYWPGDNTGRNMIFPDELTAGRQVYRALYTGISFVTLGLAFAAYLQSASMTPVAVASADSFLHDACLLTAALSLGAAVGSLFNASPLGLMPSFEGTSQDDTVDKSEVKQSGKNTAIAGIRRDDTLKFTTRGLTRITRHPLILPVAPWGFCTAYLAGGRLCDYILFGGLSVYAVAGCFAQDLRVSREEGSVGTVFQTEDRENALEGEEEERTRLRLFFEDTSFVPFKAVMDGRQSIGDIIDEGPWLQFLAGSIVGLPLEEKILQLLGDFSVA